MLTFGVISLFYFEPVSCWNGDLVAPLKVSLLLTFKLRVDFKGSANGFSLFYKNAAAAVAFVLVGILTGLALPKTSLGVPAIIRC